MSVETVKQANILLDGYETNMCVKAIQEWTVLYSKADQELANDLVLHLQNHINWERLGESRYVKLTQPQVDLIVRQLKPIFFGSRFDRQVEVDAYHLAMHLVHSKFYGGI